MTVCVFVCVCGTGLKFGCVSMCVQYRIVQNDCVCVCGTGLFNMTVSVCGTGLFNMTVSVCGTGLHHQDSFYVTELFSVIPKQVRIPKIVST